MSKSQVGAGVVEIFLEGGPYYLVPSLGACTEISSMAGGLGAAIERCNRLHFETICEIIGAGIQIRGERLNPGQRAKLIPDLVYKAGVIYCAGVCVDFVHIVANGGKPLPEEDEIDDDDGVDGEGAEAPLDSATENITG